MRAFIQHSNGLPTNVNTYAALKGFDLLGADIVPFVAEETDATAAEMSLADGDILCGYVGIVHRVFTRLGIPRPNLSSWPEQLAPHLGRRVWRSTLGHVRAVDDPVFIKPAVDDKAFQGHVRNVGNVDASFTAHLDDDFEVFCSELVPFIGEWRCFILDGQPLDAKQYKGSFRTPQPDFSVLDECLMRFANAPRGFAIDLGVTTDHRTILVEVNDGYSLGSYGLAPVAYANLLAARWAELVEPASRQRPPN